MNFLSRFAGRGAIAHAAVSAVLLAAVLGIVFAMSGPDALARALSQVQPGAILLIAFLLAAGVGLSSLRLKLIASNLGYELPLRDAVMALTVGQIAGSLFFQFFGQLAGRTAVLARRGMPPAASVVLFGYERIFALLVSLGLAGCGAIFLFGALHLDLGAGGASLLRILLGVAVAVAAGAAFVWGRQAIHLWRSMTPLLSSGFGWNAALSLSVQLTTLAAYIVAGRTLLPSIDLMSLMAASAVIMFAASLPISFAGWGLREMSSVVVLQAIGFSNASALVASLLIGVISLIVLALSALVFQFIVHPSGTIVESADAPDRPDYTQALDWILPIAAATAVFFQIYVPTTSGNLNVNLADPVVLIGAALYFLRRLPIGAPQLRIPHLGWCLAATTAVILLSFAHGLAVFGWTDWAFANRTLGWGMLLCYAATGALIVDRARREGFEILVETFVATGIAISLLNILLLILSVLTGQISPSEQRIAGFSQNPNAFAFALLITMAALLTLRQSGRLRVAALTCILVALWHTGSRAGVGTGGIILAAAVWWGSSARTIALGVVAAAAVLLIINWLPAIGAVFQSDSNFNFIAAMPWNDRGFSDNEHLKSTWLGARMFFDHPILGAGLGAFIREHIRETGSALLIHSTPVWLLAETGIFGFLIFLASAFQIVRVEYPRRHDPAALLILLMMCALAAMSAVHELLYQRVFWLLLGAALACPVLTAGTGQNSSAAPPKD